MCVWVCPCALYACMNGVIVSVTTWQFLYVHLKESVTVKLRVTLGTSY